MAPPSLTSDRLRIGVSLEEARKRAGLTIEEASERTKIRSKYLAALEAEDWAVLPSTAYAKGFMRTYARMLGLDADELVDAYRRVAGSEEPRLRPFGDPVLEARRRAAGIDDGRRRRGAILLVTGVLALAVVLALVIAGDLGDDSAHSRRHHAASGPGSGGHGQPAGAPSGPVTLRLHALRGAQLCLVGDGRALIDSQSLTPGTTAGPFHSRRFRLDLTSYGGGVLRLQVDGHPRKLRARGRSSYLVHRNGLKRTSYRGPGCP